MPTAGSVYVDFLINNLDASIARVTKLTQMLDTLDKRKINVGGGAGGTGSNWQKAAQDFDKYQRQVEQLTLSGWTPK